MKDALLLLLNELLAKNRITVDKEELKFQLLGHPSYPSLYSVTGVLDHFSIPNLSVEIPKTKENMAFLPDCFIAHFNETAGNQFVLVTKDGQNFRISYDEKRSEIMAFDAFKEAWDGIVLVIERDENIKKSTSINLTKPIAAISPVALIAWFSFFNPGVYATLHFLFSMAGLLICGLLFQHELGISTKFVDKICTGNSSKISCNDVVESKGARLFGFLKLTDLGIIYFLTAILSSLFITTHSNNFTLLFQVSILALPFTLYSIVYQLHVVKKWCFLCLGVVLVLWVQTALSLLLIEKISIFSFDLNTFLFFTLSAYFTTVIWMLVSPGIRQKRAFLDLKIRYNKFKRNTGIFNNLLERSQALDTKIPDCNEIVFGAVNSSLEMVVITNPLCGFCSEAHKLIHKAINKKIKVKIIVRFNVSPNPEHLDNRIVSKLLEIYHTKGEHKCLIEMDEVYTNKNYLQWLEKRGDASNNTYSDILAKEKDWCLENNIPFTPEVLINGRAYPKEYDFEDILFFLGEIPELEEQPEPDIIS